MAQKGVGFWSWTLSKVCNLTVGYQKQGVSSHFNVFFKSLFEYARSGLVRTMWNILVLVFFYLNKKHHPLKHGQVLKVPLAHSHLYFPLVVPLLPLPPPLHLPFPPNYNPDPLIQSCTLRALATGMLPPTSLQQWPPLPPPPQVILFAHSLKAASMLIFPSRSLITRLLRYWICQKLPFANTSQGCLILSKMAWKVVQCLFTGKGTLVN